GASVKNKGQLIWHVQYHQPEAIVEACRKRPQKPDYRQPLLYDHRKVLFLHPKPSLLLLSSRTRLLLLLHQIPEKQHECPVLLLPYLDAAQRLVQYSFAMEPQVG